MESVPGTMDMPTFKLVAGESAMEQLRKANLLEFDSVKVVVVREYATETLRDLTWIPSEECQVQLILANSPTGLSVIRHSTAHIMAQAVQEIFVDTKLGVGPPIADGFYYDFSLPQPLTPDNLVEIERRMKKIIKSGQFFTRREYKSIAEAKAELADQPYKLELITTKSTLAKDAPESVEVGGGNLTAYDNVDMRSKKLVWSDLCRGPHVPSTKYLGNFRLTKFSAAYWKGDQNNDSLQRIYGTAWDTPEALEKYLESIEQAKLRDHRRLGATLDLFSFPEEIGSGFPLFHPKGGIIRYELEQHSLHEHLVNGYQLVSTPHLTKAKLFDISGHLGWYSSDMFPPMVLDDEIDNETGQIQKEGQEYYVKPMNCPMHIMIYKSHTRSYRELPLRFFELGTVYRYEKSGVLHGLTRVRGLTQDDAHIFCTPSQLESELKSILKFILNMLEDFGLTNYYLELSTRNDDKFVGDDQLWEKATSILEKVAVDSKVKLVPDPGGAAFYGPKISVQVLDALGRNWQMSTIQLDYNLPDRFNLEFTNSQGGRERPIMIHRAIFGSIERFLGILLEHYAGLLPVWLSPVQVVGIPVSQANDQYLNDFLDKLRSAGVRTEIDDSADRMQKKIRNHTQGKVPILILVGNQDQQKDTVSFRFNDGSQLNGIDAATATKVILNWKNTKTNLIPNKDNFLAGKNK